jgi:bifunctional DNA-binding transcriptional regulator/antitoxin component of YhaV-PrlF toxin-antitoxin module
MTTVVKSKAPIAIPPAMQRRARLVPGDQVEIRAAPGVITIVAKLPSADDEYTPAQRRIIDARLAESEDDFKQGRTFGPFDTADEMIAHMKGQLKKRAGAGKTKHSR